MCLILLQKCPHPPSTLEFLPGTALVHRDEGQPWDQASPALLLRGGCGRCGEGGNAHCHFPARGRGASRPLSPSKAGNEEVDKNSPRKGNPPRRVFAWSTVHTSPVVPSPDYQRVPKRGLSQAGNLFKNLKRYLSSRLSLIYII